MGRGNTKRPINKKLLARLKLPGYLRAPFLTATLRDAVDTEFDDPFRVIELLEAVTATRVGSPRTVRDARKRQASPPE